MVEFDKKSDWHKSQYAGKKPIIIIKKKKRREKRNAKHRSIETLRALRKVYMYIVNFREAIKWQSVFPSLEREYKRE